ncbi:Outer membrane protein IcsA autotransporter precursor [Pragia fontium]|uniref:autotransporter outer membrane beta-barrel domain-containing protein n=1 Tax=Pragia fontium TaxID=82985 RepID=UPI000E0461D0|nr:autotransporter outer membrane beta-barrel domain-containing protein [Pragia fontium]SUB83930.1 Outer membrane protein IcsA autotransporter precursor [Pragia fontium]
MSSQRQIFSMTKKPLVILIGALCCNFYAQAESRAFFGQVTWQGEPNGSWHEAANWDKGLPVSDSVVMLQDGASVNLTQPTGVVKQFYSNDATLNILSGGELLVDKLVTFGYEANTKTTVLVSGIGSSIRSNGTDGNTWTFGKNGEAVIRLEKGGQLLHKGANPNTIHLGDVVGGGSGMIIATGAERDVNGNKIAAIDTDALMRVGQSGKGSLQILDGALANINTLHVAHYNGSEGHVLVSGQGSTLNTVNELKVGFEGLGTLTIEKGGVVNTGGFGAIANTYGRPNTANSWALVTGEGSAWNVNKGFFLHYGSSEGTRHRLDIRDGGAVNVTGYFIINNFEEDSEGILTIADKGSILNVTGDANTGIGLSIGHGNKGLMSITNEGVVHSSGAFVGTNPTGIGEVVVSDAGSRWINDNELWLARKGMAKMTVANQGAVESGSSSIGVFAGAKGDVLLKDEGTRWNNLGNMIIGDAGIGTLTLIQGANLTVGGVLSIGAQAGGTGTLNIGSALDKAATVAGILNVSDIKLGDTSTTRMNTGGDGTIVFNHTHFDATNGGYRFNANTSGYGNVLVHSGTTLFNGQNTYGGTTEIHRLAVARAGAKNAFSANSDYQIDNGAWLDMASYQQTLGNTTNAGLITFHTNTIGKGEAHNLLTVQGNYHGDNGTIVYNTVLAYDDAATDRFVVTGNTSGTTNVRVINAGGTGARTLDGIQIVEVQGLSDGTFVKAANHRIVAGAYEYDLARGTDANSNNLSKNWYLTSTCVNGAGDCEEQEEITPPNTGDNGDSGNSGDKGNSGGNGKNHIYRPEAGAYGDNIATANMAFVHTLHDRLGEPQYTDAVQGEIERPTSMWLRTIGGHTRSRHSGQLKTQTNRFIIHGGGDMASWSNNGEDRTHLGLMFGYVHASSNTDSNITGYSARGETDGYNAGIYGTWYDNDAEKTGLYVDSWAQYNWFTHRVNGEYLNSEKYKSRGVVLSLESGYTFLVNENKQREEKTFLQPQAQIVWMNVKSKNHREVNGTRVSSFGDGNIMTRLGSRLYWQGHHEIDHGKDRIFQPFIEANWLHNTKNFGATMDKVRVEQKGSRNLGELKLGVEGQINKQVNLWGNVSEQLGKNGYSNTTAIVGVKYMF